MIDCPEQPITRVCLGPKFRLDLLISPLIRFADTLDKRVSRRWWGPEFFPHRDPLKSPPEPLLPTGGLEPIHATCLPALRIIQDRSIAQPPWLARWNPGVGRNEPSRFLLIQNSGNIRLRSAADPWQRTVGGCSRPASAGFSQLQPPRQPVLLANRS